MNKGLVRGNFVEKGRVRVGVGYISVKHLWASGVADSEHSTALAGASKTSMTTLQMHKVMCYTLFISLMCV